MVVLREVRTRIVSGGFEVRASYKLGQLLTLRFSPVCRAFRDPGGLWCESCFFLTLAFRVFPDSCFPDAIQDLGHVALKGFWVALLLFSRLPRKSRPVLAQDQH